MVKHIIIWNFKEELSEKDRSERAVQIKNGLEGLLGVIDGLVDIRVRTEFLGSSNGDLMLDSTFRDEAALKAYQTAPEHLKVAQVVRSVVSGRSCVDYEI